MSDAYCGPRLRSSVCIWDPVAFVQHRQRAPRARHGKWNATLFVDNLTNKVAQLTTNNTQFQFNVPQLVRVSTNQPRTYGTEINYRF